MARITTKATKTNPAPPPIPSTLKTAFRLRFACSSGIAEIYQKQVASKVCGPDTISGTTEQQRKEQ